MARLGFALFSLLALVGFCAGWGWGWTVTATLWAVACWEMDRTMHDRGM